MPAPRRVASKSGVLRWKQARADYEELMAEKAADMKKYGGEENLPEWMQTM